MLDSFRIEDQTHCPIFHEFEAGAKVSQPDVTVHVHQDIVWLNIPEHKSKTKINHNKRVSWNDAVHNGNVILNEYSNHSVPWRICIQKKSHHIIKMKLNNISKYILLIILITLFLIIY